MERFVAHGVGHDPQVDADLLALNRRLAAQTRRREQARRLRAGLRTVLRRALMFYATACTLVILVGLDAVYPQYGRHLAYVFEDPALEMVAPFETCARAHRNGYYSIPQASPGYAAGQDVDGDGRACEPSLRDLPNPMWRMQIMLDRLVSPW